MIESVILLHGAGRSPRSMGKMAKALSLQGYPVHNLGYPSRQTSIEGCSDHIRKQIVQLKQTSKIHFVTHSLGGIIVRQYLQNHSLPEGARLVMLAPPNQGSELVDHLKEFSVYKWFHGPAGQELGTGPESTPNRLKPVDIEVGIIAGDKSYNPIFSALVPGPDDGTISIERTKLNEMKDFLIVSSTHTFIMDNREVMRQVVYFFRNGLFDHSHSDSP